jgi:hypothetical protein
MTKKKPAGPVPARPKLEGNWKEVLGKALANKRPQGGWPKPRQKKGSVP